MSIQANEVMQEMLFPANGVDLSTEFELQNPLTTPAGVNVRAYEALSQRGRGGSRAGLSQYIPQTVGGLGSVVQHLNILVDPTVAALPGNDDPYNQVDVPGGVPDPSDGGGTDRNPGWWTRDGGTGRQPNRRVPARSAATVHANPDDATAVQGGSPVTIFILENDDYNVPITVTITSPPTLGDASAVVVGSGDGTTIRYTPPSGTGPGGTDTLTYRLSGGGISSDADVRVSVDPGTGDVSEGEHEGTATEWHNNRDATVLDVTFTFGDGATFVIEFTAGTPIGSPPDGTIYVGPVDVGSLITIMGELLPDGDGSVGAVLRLTGETDPGVFSDGGISG